MLRIAQVVADQGRKKNWLAARLGVSPSQMMHLLRGTRSWKQEWKVLAVEALGIEDEEGLFEPVAGVQCPECGGMGHDVKGNEVQVCRLCDGEGVITREALKVWVRGQLTDWVDRGLE